MLPAVTIQKNVYGVVGAPPSQIGVLAILACSSTGTVAQVGGYARTDLAVSALGYGPLTEYAAYDINVANLPVTLIRGNSSYPGSYNGFSSAATGSSVIATTGNPYDHYNVQVNIIAGGAVGTAGITYTYSVDGNTNTSGVTALGTAMTLGIPNTGVAFSLGAGSLNAGDSWAVNTERPLLNDSDTNTGLTALSLSRLPWEGVLIDSSMSTATVGLVDTFLSGLEGRGQFKFAILNTRYKLEPLPTAESEATYATALTTLTQNQSSIRVAVGADGGHVPSPITGFNLKRPTSAILAARAMSVQSSIGIDPSYVALGALNGVQIASSTGNPFDHDEDLYPTLDGLRLVTLRSFAPGGPQGVFITNPNVIQPTGGAFPYLQLVRIANLACSIAWSILSTQLSRGVRKNPKADPQTGAVYIFEPDASSIETLVNDAYTQPFKGQVNAIRFSLSRTDNLAVAPVTLTGLISIVGLAYVKGFAIQQQFNKTIVVAN
jgi:hypothetical protein